MPEPYERGFMGQVFGAITRNTPAFRGKTVLSHRDPAFSLTRQGAAAGTLRVVLDWSAPRSAPVDQAQARSQLPDTASAPEPSTVDLGLGCLYEFAEGQRGVVQEYGSLPGSFTEPPWIRFDRDDGVEPGSGQNLFINLDRAHDFKRLLIFVFVLSSKQDFEAVHAAVTFYPLAGPQVEIPLDGAPAGARSCATALIGWQGDDLVIQRELRYVKGYQADIDAAYGWGLHWARGDQQAT